MGRRVVQPAFIFNDTATTEIYTLSLHDALPIYRRARHARTAGLRPRPSRRVGHSDRSEAHTSELQSRVDLVCPLLLEKKKRRTHDVLTAKKQAGVSISEFCPLSY